MFNKQIWRATALTLLLITTPLYFSAASERWSSSVGAIVPDALLPRLQPPVHGSAPAIRASDTMTVTFYLPLIMRNYTPMVFPNDPAYDADDQWGLDKIRSPNAWGVTTGSSQVTIAVIDSGVDLDHPDLQDKIVAGWDFVNNDDQPDDDYGHGTHVAGIAAAATDNNLGIAGVSWGARIMPLKVLNSSGSGYMSTVIDGMRYAADHGAQILNLSLGSITNSSALQDAVDYARNKGAVVVAAVGNYGSSYYDGHYNPDMYPASCQNVIGVAATTSTDGWASFSEHNAYVDVSAPGVSIYSTVPGGYNYKQGTSMATPFVSGLAALILSKWPDYTPSQVETALFNNADDLTSYPGSSGRDDYFGYGRINAYHTLIYGAETGGSSLEVQAAAQPPPTSDAPFAPGELLVKFKGDRAITSKEVTSVLERHALQVSDEIPGLGITRLTVPAGSEWEIIAALRREPLVEYAEPNYLVWALE
jgi:thermitase